MRMRSGRTTKAFALAFACTIGTVAIAAPMQPDVDARYARWHGSMSDAARMLAASADPLSQLVAAEILAEVPGERSGPHARAAIAATAAEGRATYARLRAGSRDFLVLWLAATDCRFGDALCDADGAIDDLLRLQPSNAAPWLLALDRAVRRKDATGIDEALGGIAGAQRYDQQFSRQMRAWFDAYAVLGEVPGAPDSLVWQGEGAWVAAPPDPEGQHAFDAFAGFVVTLYRGQPRVLSLHEACGASAAAAPTRRAACRDAARVLQGGDSLVVAGGATRVLFANADDDATRAEAEAVHRDLRWTIESLGALAPEPTPIESGFDLAAAHALLDAWRTHDSERAVFASFARAAGVPPEPPPDWRPRYTLAERQHMR